MDSLSIILKNCYGIASLEQTFDFSKWKTHLIYAQNGVMKTSFAKTLEDVSLSRDSKERVYGRTPERSVKVNWITEILPENVYVIHSMDDDPKFDKTSTILANEKLKKEFEEQMRLIEWEQWKLIGILRTTLWRQKSDDTIKDLCDIFWKKENEIFDFLESMETEISWSEIGFADIHYTILFDEKVMLMMKKDPAIHKAIDSYIKKYDELINKTSFLRKGFNHQNAEEVSSTLDKRGFFNAEHWVILRDAMGVEVPIRTVMDLEKALQDDQDKVFANKELKKQFQTLDKELNKNQGLSNFRWYINDNPSLIPELKDIREFRQKVIKSIIQKHMLEYKNWLVVYRVAKINLNRVVKDAKAEQEEWKNIIELYHDKFLVPFRLVIENQSDILLKQSVPVVAFEYNENGENPKSLSKKDLLDVLSNGERRALYILNILFEIEHRKRTKQEILIIIDDIADSFDYRNKYAIVEYLREMVAIPDFHILILTHNFDFFRTSQSRLSIPKIHRDNCWMIQKTTWLIEIIKAEDLNFFENLRTGYHKDLKMFLCMVPFIRNIIEYTKWQNENNYKILTSILHRKSDSDSITVEDVKKIFDEYSHPINPLAKSFNLKKGIYELIIEEAEKINDIRSINEDPRIFNKLILSIAIRLLAEDFMIQKISDVWFVSSIESEQTSVLFRKYETIVPIWDASIRVLQQVMLLTPENIHLNSFMYEPILDMNQQHLKELYNKIKVLM